PGARRRLLHKNQEAVATKSGVSWYCHVGTTRPLVMTLHGAEVTRIRIDEPYSDARFIRSQRRHTTMATGGTSARAKPFPLVRIVAVDNSANAITRSHDGASMYRAHIRTAQKLSIPTSISDLSTPENN